MAATSYSLIERAQGSSFAAAYGAQGSALDLLQIINSGSVLLNVDSTGVVHNPASSPTNGTSTGVYQSSRASGTTAQLFAASFTNPANLDVLQLVNVGGSIAHYIDYLGVSH